jgi:hypothetical protein
MQIVGRCDFVCDFVSDKNQVLYFAIFCWICNSAAVLRDLSQLERHQIAHERVNVHDSVTDTELHLPSKCT